MGLVNIIVRIILQKAVCAVFRRLSHALVLEVRRLRNTEAISSFLAERGRLLVLIGVKINLSILPWTERNWQLPAGYQDAKVQHLHRFIVCGHNVVFLDYPAESQVEL